MTTPGGPIDRVFVEIDPDTKDFSRDLKRDTDAAYDKLDKSTQNVTRKITKSFDKMGREIERQFTLVEQDGKLTAKVIEKSFDDAGEKIERSFRVASEKGVKATELIATISHIAADSAADSWERAGERIEDAFREANRVVALKSREMARHAENAADGVEGSFGGLGKIFSSIGASLVSIGSAIGALATSSVTPAGLITFAAILTAIVALTGPVIGLTGALADLLGLVAVIPAGAGVAVAAIVPLVIAFQGFSDAISAIIEKDPEKIKKALDALSPSARKVALEFQKLLPSLERFKKAIQESFFRPVVKDLTLLTNALLPGFQSGMSKIATAIGRAVSNFAEFLRQPAQVKIFNDLLATTARIIDIIAPAFQTLGAAIFKSIGAGLPFVERLSKAFAGAIEKFADFLTTSIDNGSFEKFFDDAIKTVKELIDLGKSLGNLFVSIFGNADDEGRDFLSTLTDTINKMADFFKSAEGQDFLQDTLEAAKTTFSVIAGLGAAFTGVLDFIGDIDDAVSDAQTAVGNFFTDLGDFLSSVSDSLLGFRDKIISFFVELPGKIIGFLQSLPGKLEAFFNFLFDSVLRAIGTGIGLLLFAFTVLPGMIIDKIKELPGLLANFFTNLWHTVTQRTTEGGSKIVDFVKSLPGRMVAALTQLGPAIAGLFTRALDNAKALVIRGFNAIVGFVKSVPGRIRDAFKTAGSVVSDIGGAIAGAIKSMLNRIISRINEGISNVDKFLPGDLPRIPQLAAGGVIEPRQGGTLANLAEAGEREIVTPESLLRKIFAEGQSGVTFGPGSVVVSFEGVVPTVAEARQTGNAVGLGILDAISKRNVRTTVRAM